MSADDKGRVDWRALATDASRYGRAGAGIVAQRAREREAELLSDLAAAIAAEREAAAKVANNGAVAAFEEMTDAGHDTEKKHTYAECMDAVGKALTECAAAIRARGAS